MAEKKQSRELGRFSRISSTCISNLNYYPASGTLEVTFHNPTIGKWVYFNVDAYTAGGLVSSSSRGAYFNAYIKGVFEYERVS